MTTAYLITSTVTTPLYGKLSDIYGRRPMFLDRHQHLHPRLRALHVLHLDVRAGRVPRGPGHRRRRSVLDGAGHPRRHRPAAGARQVPGLLPGRLRHVQRGSARWSAASSPGRTRILGITGWRWVFLVNVPIGIIALVVVAKVLHIPHIRRDHRIDWWGAAALDARHRAAADRRRTGPGLGLGLGPVAGLFILGVIGVIAFILVESRMKDEALIPMRLFRSRVFSRQRAVASSSVWACSADC